VASFLETRDEGCRFPGCGSRFCDAHHVVPWAEGGETSLENLVLLCRRHHRRVHEGGWTLELDGTGSDVTVLRPDGRELAEVPPRPPVPDDPVLTLMERQRALGIDQGTPTTKWDGTPMDTDWALSCLYPSDDDVSAETPPG